MTECYVYSYNNLRNQIFFIKNFKNYENTQMTILGYMFNSK